MILNAVTFRNPAFRINTCCAGKRLRAEPIHSRVIAGLVPAIHFDDRATSGYVCWIPGTSPGMTGKSGNRACYILETLQMRHGGGREGQ